MSVTNIPADKEQTAIMNVDMKLIPWLSAVFTYIKRKISDKQIISGVNKHVMMTALSRLWYNNFLCLLIICIYM